MDAQVRRTKSEIPSRAVVEANPHPPARVSTDVASPEALAVIQATLAPAFLMTGGGIFLNFIQSRLFRVNDHLRRLASEPESRKQQKLVALALHRGRILRNAIAFGVTGLGFVAVTMLVLLAGVVAPGKVPTSVVVIFFGSGLACIAAGLIIGARDAFLSFRSISVEFGPP